MKSIVIGMGNPLLSDDGVGIAIVEELKIILPASLKVDIVDTFWGGLRMVDLLAGYDLAILVDAIQIGKKPAGTIHLLNSSQLIHTVRMISFHDLNIQTALEFARLNGIPMPREISIYAIEVNEIRVFSETCTPEVEASVIPCARMILEELKEKAGSQTFSYGSAFPERSGEGVMP